MEELWQRYRSFWVPVLVGLGVFLIGLIAVHAMTDDPATAGRRVTDARKKLERVTTPTSQQQEAARRNAEAFRGRVEDWSVRLDQADGEDPVAFAVARALRASILRGIEPDRLRASLGAEGGGSREVLAPFEGDAVAAARALQRYEEALEDRLNLLRTGDPNVGFGRLLSDVVGEFRLRANRADVALPTDALGFAGVTTTPASLVQRLLNLALASDLVDLAIRGGARSVDGIRVDARPDVESSESFLREWPVRIEVTGDMLALQPLVDYLTDPQHPVPLTQFQMTQPSRKSAAATDGLVKLFAEASSTLVRPGASLDLDQEDQ